MRLVLLAMIAVCIATLPFMREVKWQKYRVLIAATISMFGLLLAFHYKVPNPYHADFRHVFPALVPLCLLYAKVAERLSRWSRILSGTSVAIGILMVTLSVVLFVRVP